MSERTCEACRHAEHLQSEQQIVCLHPDVSQRSFEGKRVIGLDAATCRSSKTACTPVGRWWQARLDEAQS